MGIYRTLLEEEVPHLDDNNNPDDQIKELMDVIEDHDANEAEQKAAQDAAFGPDCGVDDIMDESAMAIYEFECGHAAIMQAIGVHELQEAAAGRDFIMEAADVKGFFKSIKDKITAFFKKVWQVLQRWAGNIGAAFTSNKKFVEKYGKLMEEGYSKFDKDKSKLKNYSFAGVDRAIDISNKQEIVDIIKFCKETLVDPIKDAVSSKNGSISEDLTAENLEGELDGYRGGFCGQNNTSAADFPAALKKHLYGEEKDEPMKVADVKAYLSGRKDDRKTVNTFLSNSKTQYKKTMEAFSSAEAAVNKMEAGPERNKLISYCTRVSAYVRGLLTMTQTFRNATCSAINARARQARRYGMAYVAAANKSKHKGFQKESTEYGFLGSLGLV